MILRLCENNTIMRERERERMYQMSLKQTVFSILTMTLMIEFLNHMMVAVVMPMHSNKQCNLHPRTKL